MAGTTASGWPYITETDEPLDYDAHSLALATKLEADAALKSHTHTQAQSHNTPDTNATVNSLHHTIGTGATQAAPGNHMHALDDLSNVNAPSATNGQALVYTSGTWAPGTVSGGSAGHTVLDEGASLTARTGLNFVGAGVTVTDDAANNRTVVTVPGDTAPVLVLGPGVPVPGGTAAGTVIVRMVS